MFRVTIFFLNEDTMLNVGENINESTFIKMGDLKVWIIVVEKETKIEFFPKVANIQFFFE